MRLIGDTLLEAYGAALLIYIPRFFRHSPGLTLSDRRIEYGVKVAGITVHYVDEGMDTGPIIAQKAFEIQENDTLENIEHTIHELEHKWYPSVVKQLLGLNNRGEKA